MNIQQPWNIVFLIGFVGIWMWAIGQGMMLQNWLAGWLVLLGFAAMYFLRIPREEQMMCEAFGEQYRESMRRTGRLLPRPKSKKAT